MRKAKPYSTREIAKHLGVPRDRVHYAIKQLQIQPTERAGRSHLFNHQGVTQIQKFLTTMDSRRRDSAINGDVAIIVRERDKSEAAILKSVRSIGRRAVGGMIRKTLTVFRRTIREAITNSKTGGDKAGNDSKNKN